MSDIYYDEDNNSGLGLMIFLTILFLPVIPAGDMAICIVNSFGKEDSYPPNYVYIITWIAFAYGWFKLWISIGQHFFYETWKVITLLYVQGLFFSIILGSTECAKWSKWVYLMFNGIFIGNSSN
jgi:hypothetical protein